MWGYITSQRCPVMDERPMNARESHQNPLSFYVLWWAWRNRGWAARA
jgi:hypothetical protein